MYIYVEFSKDCSSSFLPFAAGCFFVHFVLMLESSLSSDRWFFHTQPRQRKKLSNSRNSRKLQPPSTSKEFLNPRVVQGELLCKILGFGGVFLVSRPESTNPVSVANTRISNSPVSDIRTHTYIYISSMMCNGIGVIRNGDTPVLRFFSSPFFVSCCLLPVVWLVRDDDHHQSKAGARRRPRHRFS